MHIAAQDLQPLQPLGVVAIVVKILGNGVFDNEIRHTQSKPCTLALLGTVKATRAANSRIPSPSSGIFMFNSCFFS